MPSRAMTKLMYSMNQLNLTPTEQDNILNSVSEHYLTILIGFGLIAACYLVVSKLQKNKFN